MHFGEIFTAGRIYIKTRHLFLVLLTGMYVGGSLE